ncbi:superinfection immunity protein [Swingsia samuiensis]|uniref:Superinfection immunity protein n=1 Tax=Swingsia samuiensis TaxID=1293412 RepID=A0A4Y6UIJ7_9PROT|nr:superinfection immunity protein [Swingsia samuiensis]QDH17423.1 superinfection immunity protein [Swingsia samuiensis]
MNKVSLIALFPLFIAFHATAQTYHPDFECSRVSPSNSIAHLLCDDSDSAKQELIFDQTYYALRQQVGRAGWQSLKKEVIEDQKSNAQCLQGAPDTNGRQDVDPTCFQNETEKLTEKYKQRLSGPALEEANRPIDEHIALQKRLAELGFLPSNTKIDGVYGSSVRQAIETWQRVNNRPLVNGFISDDDAGILNGNGNNEDRQINNELNSSNISGYKTDTSTKKADLSPFHIIFLLILIIFGIIFLYIYMLPTIFAVKRGNENIGMVAFINLLLGWTLFGWCVALFMAGTMQRKEK